MSIVNFSFVFFNNTHNLVFLTLLVEGADRQSKIELLQELNLMTKLGFHPNIVRLLGYCMEKGNFNNLVLYIGSGVQCVFSHYFERL